jgi:hypothetical protein
VIPERVAVEALAFSAKVLSLPRALAYLRKVIQPDTWRRVFYNNNNQIGKLNTPYWSLPSP